MISVQATTLLGIERGNLHRVGILHHDSSAIIVVDLHNPTLWIILNVFDLVGRIEAAGCPCGGHRTGSRAVEVQKAIQHHLRHHLQPLVYAVVWWAVQVQDN